MKILNLIVLLILFTINAYAQNETIHLQGMLSSHNSSVDTLYFKSGIPQVFLIQISGMQNNYLSNEDNVEKKRLENHLNVKEFKLNHIVNPSYIQLENGEIIDLSSSSDPYRAIVFWNGKKDSKLKKLETNRNSSQFVTEELNRDKLITYLIKIGIIKNENNQLNDMNNFTEKSKQLMDVFLEQYTQPNVFKTQNTLFYQQDQKNVHTIIMYEDNLKEPKFKSQEIVLNKLGKPVKINEFDRNGLFEITEFEYENDILKSIIKNGNSTQIQFNDNQLFYIADYIQKDVTHIVTLENGYLLEKRFFVEQGKKIEEYDYVYEDRFEKGCINNYLNGVLKTSSCVKNEIEPNEIFAFTSYNDRLDEIQKIRFKMVKKENREMIITISDNSNEVVADYNFKFNDNYLVETFVYDKRKRVVKCYFEYTYY